jgi:hypothetical protein
MFILIFHIFSSVTISELLQTQNWHWFKDSLILWMINFMEEITSYFFQFPAWKVYHRKIIIP